MSGLKFPSSEFEIISKMQDILGFVPNDSYELGIGDDAAVRSCKRDELLVITTDISAEDVHFSLKTMSLQEAAYRAMVSNISDCAAMGAHVDSALVQLSFPKNCSDIREKILSVYNGFSKACSRWKFPIVGGDLSVANQWVIGITLLGKSEKGARVLKRTGASDGDYLWVSGFPGRSNAGFDAINKWGRDRVPEKYTKLVKDHIEPVPKIELGLLLASDPEVHAMMDLSDGLSKDCRTLSYVNNLGIELKMDTSRVPKVMIQLSNELEISLLDWYLHGGEDYELLFAASPAFNPSSISPESCSELICIGQFTSRFDGLRFENDGVLTEIKAGSWDHINCSIM